MEIVIRFGADRRKAKIIEEQQRELNRLNEEVRGLKIDKGILVTKNNRLQKSVNYYKKKVGKPNENKSKIRIQTNPKDRERNNN